MKQFLIISFLFLLFACSNVEKAPEPHELLSKEQMATILSDLYIIEGAISSNRSAYIESGIQPSSYIYKKYDIDSLTFKENLNYYNDRVEDYLFIMDKIQDDLKSLQDSVRVRQEKINKGEKETIPKNTIKEQSPPAKKK
ncbi:uncharacterized protein DUF4296 [Nonlabens dokdonensis]|uniref:Dihydroorotase n=2 Tax=Nonlabens dokdonensis TaxID=328515 RepID=L7W8P5_NONDD|nr:DUF4296 domain-containing protein [Nonlabens dokdonensis]AGC76186.1 dihydroorotase [Nonlabens dokdonensis DSW-6]PZX43855.1 uncharacterized protein DUF4296 [Nonlabens dokdonensis]